MQVLGPSVNGNDDIIAWFTINGIGQTCLLEGQIHFQGTLPFNGKTKVSSGVWNQDWPWDERTRNNQCSSVTLYTNWKLQLCHQCCQILTQSQQKNQAFSSIPSEHSIQPRMHLLLELSLLQRDFKYALRSSLLIQNLTLTHTQSGWPPWQDIYYYDKIKQCHRQKQSNWAVNGTKYVCVQELVSTRFSQKGFSDGLLYSKNKGKCHYTSSVPFKEEGCQWCKVRLCTGSTHGSTEASIHQQTISFQKTPALTSGWFTAERAAGTVWVL